MTINTTALVHTSGQFQYQNFTIHRVKDGDTFVASIDLGFRCHFVKETFRLAGIDAPETKGKTKVAGLAARDYLADLLAAHPLFAIQPVGIERDKYGRILADILLATDMGHTGPTTIQTLMVNAGHAQWKDYK